MDTITLDVAGEIDTEWANSGMPDNGLRIYGLRRSGNRTMTFLGVPSLNGSAPCYVLSNGKYLHVTGPTLAEWQEREHFNAVDLKNEQTYRSLAQDCIDGAQAYAEPFKGWALQDAELFNERADFYAQRAASR